ncbi:MAG: alpha/beta fold hydrolase [Myxococcota bacterium]
MFMLLLTTFLACRPSFPEPTGPYDVTRFEVTTDQGRLGWVLAPTADAVRARGRWDVAPDLTKAAFGFGWPLRGWIDRHISVADDALVDDTRVIGPGVLLLPGATNVPHQSTALGLGLASQGHVVFQVDLGLGAHDLDVPTEATEEAARAIYDVLERDALPTNVRQVGRALDWFAAPSEPLPGFASPILVGHSHGGAVALEHCRTSEACGGVVNLDGPTYAMVQEFGVATPWVHIASRDPAVLTQGDLERLGWADFYSDVKQAELDAVAVSRGRSPSTCAWFMEEAGHLDFTDFPFLVPGHRSDLSAELAHERTFHIVRAAIEGITGRLTCAGFEVGEGFTAR